MEVVRFLSPDSTTFCSETLPCGKNQLCEVGCRHANRFVIPLGEAGGDTLTATQKWISTPFGWDECVLLKMSFEGKPRFGLSKNGASQSMRGDDTFSAERPCESTLSGKRNELNKAGGEAHFAEPEQASRTWNWKLSAGGRFRGRTIA